MALPKLPCEYPELKKRRFQECFGDLDIEQQKKLIEIISKIENICKV